MLSKKNQLILILIALNVYLAFCSYQDFFNKKQIKYQNFNSSAIVIINNITNYSNIILHTVNQKIIQDKLYKADEIFSTLADINQFSQSNNFNNDISSVIYWIGNDNYLLSSSAGKINKPINLSARKYLEDANKNVGKITISEPVIGAISNEYILPIALTATGSKGYIIGTSVLAINIKEIINKINSLNIENGDFAIFYQNKLLLSSSDNLIKNNEKSSEKSQILTGLLSKKSDDYLNFVKNDDNFKIIYKIKTANLGAELKKILLPYFLQLIILIYLLFGNYFSSKNLDKN